MCQGQGQCLQMPVGAGPLQSCFAHQACLGTFLGNVEVPTVKRLGFVLDQSILSG